MTPVWLDNAGTVYDRRPGCRSFLAGSWAGPRGLAFASLVLVFAWLGPDAQAYDGAIDSSVAPVARAVANSAMTLLGEPERPGATAGSGVRANRPLRLADAGAPPVRTAGSVTPARPGRVVLASSEQPEAAERRETRAVESDSIIGSITRGGQDAGRISVARNSSTILNLKTNVDAVEVSDPTIADVYLTSPRRIVVMGKTFGTTQLLLRIGQEQRTFHVDVELDLSSLMSFVKALAPTADVRARSVNGTIFLSGTVPGPATARQINDMAGLVQGGAVVSNLTVAGVQQIMLRVVVAEVNKEAIRRLGVNWAIGGSDFSRDFFFSNNLSQLNPTVFGSSGLANVRVGQQVFGLLPTANGPNTNVTFGFPRAEFQMFLNALRQNGLSRTLAEPNLVAISGQTATFLAGGEVPIPVTQGGASQGAITVQYKEFGVRLGFTPTVVGGQVMRLHIMSEVSEAVPSNDIAGGFPLFTFTTRRVESTIECGNGQTFAIAGLLNDRVRANASKIPGLGDLPVLGTLFSSTDYQRSITELVVLVTPQLVEPLDPQQVPPPPGSLMTEPTDFELFALQKLEGTPKPRPEADGVPRDAFPVKTRVGGETQWPTSQLALHGPWGLAEFEEN